MNELSDCVQVSLNALILCSILLIMWSLPASKRLKPWLQYGGCTLGAVGLLLTFTGVEDRPLSRGFSRINALFPVFEHSVRVYSLLLIISVVVFLGLIAWLFVGNQQGVLHSEPTSNAEITFARSLRITGIIASVLAGLSVPMLIIVGVMG